MSTIIEPRALVPEAGLGLAFLPGDPPALIVDHGGPVQVWSVDGERLGKLQLKRGGRREPLLLGVHAKRVAGGIKTVRVLDLDGNEAGPAVSSRKYCTGLGLSSDGRLLAAGFDHLRLVEIATGDVRWKALPQNDLGQLAFSPDDSRLLATARSGGAHLLDVETGALLASHEGHYEHVRARKDGGFVAAGFRASLLWLDADGVAEGAPPSPLPPPTSLVEMDIDEDGRLTPRSRKGRDGVDASFTNGLALRNGDALVLARPGRAPNRVHHRRLGDLILPDRVVGFRAGGPAERPQAISGCGRWLALTIGGTATAIYAVDELFGT